GSTATLEIDAIDTHGVAGRLTVDGLVAGAAISSVAGAEADVLAGMSFTGSPLRVYLSFIALPGGEALAVISLYDDHRIEVRVMRGGASPVYAIYSLAEEST